MNAGDKTDSFAPIAFPVVAGFGTQDPAGQEEGNALRSGECRWLSHRLLKGPRQANSCVLEEWTLLPGIGEGSVNVYRS
jgi:hypothetical protein